MAYNSDMNCRQMHYHNTLVNAPRCNERTNPFRADRDGSFARGRGGVRKYCSLQEEECTACDKKINKRVLAAGAGVRVTRCQQDKKNAQRKEEA